ncbi:MAG: 4Fe-4S dicluster domain-containing protein [Ruminococcaceae bacterium]|nr:4Fe-4S dicluster domain-containing protein [Oscillospiraceae bacterium]
MSGEYSHSVMLDEKLCKGCTNCIKKCPMEAIRVQHGKAKILNDRCIDCGECIRTCPYKAKVALTDSWDLLAEYKYTIALPAPSLYMQFDLNTYSRKHIMAALKKLGFDYVYEVARGAEISTILTNKYLHENKEKWPLISTACPAVVRLIQLRYPNLIPHLMPIKSPMEIAAQNARREFCKINGVEPEDVGVFFISPCAAKMTSVKAPLEVHKSGVNGVIPIKTVYFKILKLLSKMKQQDVDDIMLQAGKYGVRWASTGGEALSIDSKRVLYVDGIQNVVKVLEDLEDDKIKNIEFIEASACTGGCTGGPLTVENMYVAKNRSRQQLEDEPAEYKEIEDWELEDTAWEKTIEHYEISKLDPDMFKAMEKLNKMNEIYEQLPALDCGACGSPSCRALAEDVVRGKAKTTDCIFILRRKIRKLANEMMMVNSGLDDGIDEKNSEAENENK